MEQDLRMSRSYTELDDSIAMLMPSLTAHVEGPQLKESLEVRFKCRTSGRLPVTTGLGEGETVVRTERVSECIGDRCLYHV